MSSSAKTRAVVVCCGLAGCFTLFSARLVELHVTRAQEWARKGTDKHVNRVGIHAKRGIIQDVNGEPLAQNEPTKTLIADGSLLKDPEAVAQILSGPLGFSPAQMLERLAAQREDKVAGKKVPSQYIVLKHKVPESVALEIKAQLDAKNLRGIHTEQDYERIYPNGQMLCHVVGYLNNENSGMDGVERTLDQYLRGHEGFRVIERDGKGRELVAFRGQERAARDGNNVKLTIDMGIQQIVESELESACKQLKPKMATCVIMRPQTGEILAMANRPNFDPNKIENVPEEVLRNRAITDMVEPGSTFKIVTTAAALQQKLVNANTFIFCENGHFNYGGKILHDTHPYGDLSVSDILVKSSNIGAAKLGIQLGEQKLYEFVRRFGFGERTGINLPRESSGVVHPTYTWSKVSITHVPMGHEVGVTALQIVSAMSTIANGGRLLMPQIVREVTDAEGNVIQGFQPVEVRRVVSEATAHSIRDALVDVVSKRGTAVLAHVSGFKVAGKTGTAQKIGPSGTYEKKYVVSFAGFMPAEAPEFVAIVMFDEAQTKSDQYYGGSVAAPVFSRIGERVARYMNLTPSPDDVDANTLVTQTERVRD